MSLNKSDLIKFVDQNELTILGSGNSHSKVKALQRLIQKGLMPKPIWKGGKSSGYWENDIAIKQRILWLDEKKTEGLSYSQMLEELSPQAPPKPNNMFLECMLTQIEDLLRINPENLELNFLKAKILLQMGNLEKALKLLLKCERNCRNCKELLFYVYYEMVKIYVGVNDKQKEHLVCEKLIDYAQKTGNDKHLGISYVIMGNQFSDENPQKAEDYYLKSIELLDDTVLQGTAYFYLSYLLIEKMNFEEAEDYIKKAVSIFAEEKKTHKVAVCKSHLGLIYLNSKKYDDALKIFKESKEIISESQDLHNESRVNLDIGRTYQMKGVYTKAIEHLRQAYSIALKINNPVLKKMILEQFSVTYGKMGNDKQCRFFHEESEKVESYA